MATKPQWVELTPRLTLQQTITCTDVDSWLPTSYGVTKPQPVNPFITIDTQCVNPFMLNLSTPLPFPPGQWGQCTYYPQPPQDTWPITTPGYWWLLVLMAGLFSCSETLLNLHNDLHIIQILHQDCVWTQLPDHSQLWPILLRRLTQA